MTPLLTELFQTFPCLESFKALRTENGSSGEK